MDDDKNSDEEIEIPSSPELVKDLVKGLLIRATKAMQIIKEREATIQVKVKEISQLQKELNDSTLK